MLVEIAIVLLCTVLITMVEHYAAAWYTGGRMWPRMVSYVLGAFSILVPVSGWLIWQWLATAEGHVRAIAALIVIWLATIIAGVAVLSMYLVDDWLQARREAREGRQRERIALDMVLGQHRDTNDE